MFLNIRIDWIILKTYDQQFTLTTKKSLHIIFKSFKKQLETFLLVVVMVADVFWWWLWLLVSSWCCLSSTDKWLVGAGGRAGPLDRRAGSFKYRNLDRSVKVATWLIDSQGAQAWNKGEMVCVELLSTAYDTHCWLRNSTDGRLAWKIVIVNTQTLVCAACATSATRWLLGTATAIACRASEAVACCNSIATSHISPDITFLTKLTTTVWCNHLAFEKLLQQLLKICSGWSVEDLPSPITCVEVMEVIEAVEDPPSPVIERMEDPPWLVMNVWDVAC